MIKKWGTHPLVVGYYEHIKPFRIFRRVWLYTLFAYLMAPLIALRYAYVAKKPHLYPFYVIRQYAVLLGYIYGWLTWARRMSK